MFVIDNTKLFDKPVTDGKIGLMENEFFYSEGNYYSKKDGSLIELELLLEHDQKRMQQAKFEIPVAFKPFEKEILEKERKALKEIALIYKHFPNQNYTELRRMVYFILNSARACKKGFIYKNHSYAKHDFKIEFVKTKDFNSIEAHLLPKALSPSDFKDELIPEYAASVEFIDFSIFAQEKTTDNEK